MGSQAQANPRAVLWGTLAVLAVAAVPLAFKEVPAPPPLSLPSPGRGVRLLPSCRCGAGRWVCVATGGPEG